MGYFPLCVDLRQRTVLLIGSGPQSEDKVNKLRPFGAKLRQTDVFHPEDLTSDVAFVVVGDTDRAEAERISALCTERRIPVNVVDEPELCSFFFPALITRGGLTVSVSTGGNAPAAAAFISGKISEQLPDRTEEILDWLQDIRQRLYQQLPKDAARAVLRRITREAFHLGRPLTAEETDCIRHDCI